MGIQGLLKYLKDATSEIHIREYSGRCVAIDTYCWLHRGAFACADKLAKGEKTDQYVKYCMKYVDMLETYNVRPILVFDGCHLPSKREVEKQRRERRELYMQKGKQFLREGRLNEARDAFTKCISVTPQMALHVMKAARDRGIDCIVAPYEADAQLAYLLKHGYAQAVVTEDSDLLCFGCEKVILKMDLTGRAQEVSLDKLENVKSLQGFTFESFRHMCILSGCDYLPNIKGVGLGKACKALKLVKNKDIYQAVRKLHQYIKGLAPVEVEYTIGFERADNTFLYQLVIDPKTRKMVPLNPYPPDIAQEDLKYAGPLLSDAKALQIAWGNIDVNNGNRLGDFNADEWLNLLRLKGKKKRWISIWQRNYLSQATIDDFTSSKNSKNETKTQSLRGKEAVIDIKGFLTKKKTKTDLLDGEKALELCSQSTSEEKMVNDRAVNDCEDKSENFDLVNIYKTSEPSPKKSSLPQRMLSNKTMGMNVIVKSRFFTVADDYPSFVEESETSSITHVDETPETSNSSHTYAEPTIEGDDDLNSILQEMETTIKAEIKPQANEKKLSFNSIKSPKKRKELLEKLKEFQEQKEVRTPLGLDIETTPVKRKSMTPIKRKNPFAVSQNHHPEIISPAKRRKSSPKKTPACLKKFKRIVIKPPAVPLDNSCSSLDGEKSHPGDGDREQTFSPSDIGESSVPKIENKAQNGDFFETPDLYSEDIPILDGKNSINTCIKREKISIMENTAKTKTEAISPLRRVLRNKNSPEKNLKSNNMRFQSNSEPILLSSDDENEKIPYIDDVSNKVCKRQISLGLNKNTPPQVSTGLVKSKYFGDAKASGLRKKESSKKSLKKKSFSQENLKNQPRITSLFSKTASKKKPLSPSENVIEVDHTPEFNDNEDVGIIKAKMMATRKLFNKTPK